MDELTNNKKINLITIYAGSHANSNILNYDLILPIKHYFEETDISLIFKADIKYANRAIDNTRIFIYFL
jgi:hypothetical protein